MKGLAEYYYDDKKCLSLSSVLFIMLVRVYDNHDNVGFSHI